MTLFDKEPKIPILFEIFRAKRKYYLDLILGYYDVLPLPSSRAKSAQLCTHWDDDGHRIALSEMSAKEGVGATRRNIPKINQNKKQNSTNI